jgi:RNA polymerase sigma-70 factor (ECF subfamily)
MRNAKPIIAAYMPEEETSPMRNDDDKVVALPDEQKNAAEDQELMERIGKGDSEAFRLFVNRHLRRTVRFAAQMTGSADDAEDIAQTALLKLWDNAASWTAAARVTTWLHRVTYNACIDHLRSEKRRSKYHHDAGMLLESRDDDTAEKDMLKAGLEACVREALAELPDRQKAALILCYYDGTSQREAAEILDVSEKAVESLLYRARESMRHRLGGMLEERGYHDHKTD